MSAKSNFIDADTSMLDNKLRFVKVAYDKDFNIMCRIIRNIFLLLLL